MLWKLFIHLLYSCYFIILCHLPQKRLHAKEGSVLSLVFTLHPAKLNSVIFLCCPITNRFCCFCFFVIAVLIVVIAVLIVVVVVVLLLFLPYSPPTPQHCLHFCVVPFDLAKMFNCLLLMLLFICIFKVKWFNILSFTFSTFFMPIITVYSGASQLINAAVIHV